MWLQLLAFSAGKVGLYHSIPEKKSIDLMEEIGMDMYFALFNMDTGCVDAWLTDGTIVSINCTDVDRVNPFSFLTK